MNEDLIRLLKMYKSSMGINRKVQQFYQKLTAGKATYADLQKISSISGGIVAKLFEGMFPDGIPPDAPDMIIAPTLRSECLEILGDARKVQASVNAGMGIRLNPVEVKIDEERLKGLVESIVENGITEETKQSIVNHAMYQADNSMRQNAFFQESCGMSPTVTRIYDGVGLKAGACQWCLDRVGTDVPVREAVRLGMFERHAGCGCVIEYSVNGDRKRQGDWTKNAWVDSDSTLEKRKTIGL